MHQRHCEEIVARFRFRPGGALHDLDFRVCGQHLIMHAADPMPSRADLSVRHGEKIFSQRRAEGLEYVLRGIERDAAHQKKLRVQYILPGLRGRDDNALSPDDEITCSMR